MIPSDVHASPPKIKRPLPPLPENAYQSIQGEVQNMQDLLIGIERLARDLVMQAATTQRNLTTLKYSYADPTNVRLLPTRSPPYHRAATPTLALLQKPLGQISTVRQTVDRLTQPRLHDRNIQQLRDQSTRIKSQAESIVGRLLDSLKSYETPYNPHEFRI